MTTTQTAEKQSTTDAPQESQNVAVFQPPRLPWHPAFKDAFGIDKGQWKVLVESIFPAAKTPDSIALVLSYCKARNLDPFKRPVHIVPMWSSEKRANVETVWPGISELRTTAFRTGNYAGSDEAEFGHDMNRKFFGRVKKKEGWEDAECEVTFPEWCRITVYRALGGTICKFVGPKVYWIESYATRGGSDLPNEMWETRPRGQLEKCAEAAALRKAFPEEIGNELTAEEMAGRSIDAPPMKDVTPPPERPTREDTAAKAFPETEQPTAEDQAEAEDAERRLDAEYAAAVNGTAPADDGTDEVEQPPAEITAGKKKITLHWPDGKKIAYATMTEYRDAFKAAVRVNHGIWSMTENQETLQRLVEIDNRYQAMADEIESVLAEEIVPPL